VAWYGYAKSLKLMDYKSGATKLLGSVAGPRYHRIEANGPSGAVLLWEPENSRALDPPGGFLTPPGYRFHMAT
jgi:hypothetical protein